MRIAVHHRSDAHSDHWSWRWLEEFKRRGLDMKPLDFFQADIIQQVRDCDGVMWHWLHYRLDDKLAAPKILDTIELHLGIPVFPNLATRWHFDEKVAQHYLLQAINAPRVPSWVFWRYDDAAKFVEECTYPIVFKTSVGAGSANVLKLDSSREAKAILKKIFFGGGFKPYTVNEMATPLIPHNMRQLKQLKTKLAVWAKWKIFHNDDLGLQFDEPQRACAYFQEFMPDNDHDIRVLVMGKRALGLTRGNRPNDFRASGGGRLDYDPSKVPIEAVRIAYDISRKCGFQCMAYDFLRTGEGKLVVNEISYSTCSVGMYDCPGYWDDELNWHDGHIWVEHAVMDAFLEEIEAGKRDGR